MPSTRRPRADPERRTLTVSIDSADLRQIELLKKRFGENTNTAALRRALSLAALAEEPGTTSVVLRTDADGRPIAVLEHNPQTAGGVRYEYRRDRKDQSQLDATLAHIAERRERPAGTSKITAVVDREMFSALARISKETRKSKTAIIREAIQDLLTRDQPRNGSVRSSNGKVVVRSISQALFYSRVIVAALDEAIEYDPARHHNEPPPSLRIDSDDYLKDIQALVFELRRLNEKLEAMKASTQASRRARKGQVKEKPEISEKAVERSTVDVKKHLNTFLNKYASTLGVSLGAGTGMLAVGGMAALLYQLGLPDTIFEQIMRKLR